jgi:predicted alpha-1,6-mannanase (GH76 family)
LLTKTRFSYNQGVYLSSQLDLHEATGDIQYLRNAEEAGVIGVKSAPWVNPQGQITDARGVDQHIDGANFRSIWIRHLNQLYQASSNQQVRELIKAHITVNFNLLLSAGDVEKGLYSLDWFGGYTPKTIEYGQCAALDVLTAAYVVNSDKH